MTTAEQTKAAKKAAVDAAMSVAQDVAENRLDCAQLDAAVEAECRELFGRVAGPDDPLWELHVSVARQVLGLDGIPVDELAEWLAVSRAAQGIEAAGEPSWIETALAGDYVEVECVCGETIDTDMPHVEPEVRAGVLWHGNTEGGGHASDTPV